MDSFSAYLLDEGSQVHNLFTRFNASYSEFLEAAEKCAEATPNVRLRKGTAEERDRTNRALFAPQPSQNNLIAMRNELLATDPMTNEVKLQIGNVSLFLYDFYTASLYYSDVCTEGVELSVGQWYLISIALTHFRCWESVIEILQPIVRDLGGPYRFDGFFRLGIAYKRTQQYVKAIESFQNAFARPPPWVSCFDIAVEISHVYSVQGNWKSACSQIESVKSRPPAVVQQQAFIYLCSEDVMKLDLGINILSEYEGTIHSIDLLYLKARLLYKRGRLQDAFFTLYAVITLDQGHGLAWCALGNIYMRMNQLHDAIVCYEKAIACDNEMIEAWMNFSACIETDPQVREQHQGFISAFDNPPIRLRQMRVSCDEPYVPVIVEPNDRERLPSAADSVEDVFCSEIPSMDESILADVSILTMSHSEEAEEANKDDITDQTPTKTDAEEEEESENEMPSQDALSGEPETDEKPQENAAPDADATPEDA